MQHKPVLLKESIGLLNLHPGMTVVDGTLGSGGHSREILKKIGPTGRLVALDIDPAAISRVKNQIEPFQTVSFQCENFKNIDQVLNRLNISKVDAVILDIGFSSDQLENASRGFSFEREGPLDMRMNPSLPVSAYDWVNRFPQNEIARILKEYGEERSAAKIAAVICEARRKKPIETTSQLSGIIMESLLKNIKKRSSGKNVYFKRHPATRTFQALRIAVNQELDSLKETLPKVWPHLKDGARFAVITFHSLEDRIVKNQFRAWAHSKEGRLVTKKPVSAAAEEIRTNPRARSAKLRVVERSR